MAIVFSVADPRLWERLSEFDLKNSVWVSPTDTVYGFGTAYSNRAGLRAIQKLKGVSNQHAIALVSGIEQARQIAELRPKHRSILEAHWPGPISFVLPALKGTGTVALRWPADPFLMEFLTFAKEPMYSTSCNRHGDSPVESALEAVAEFPEGVDFFVDGGIRQNLMASTLVSLLGTAPQVLRRGAASFD